MRVAVDVTPLLGARTGIAQAVEGLLGALPPEVDVVPWVLSARGTPPPGARRLPLPASTALKLWGRADRPTADRWLGDADVVHGTNYTVPPMRRRPTTVTVNDCWCARHPETCRPEVVALTAVVRRAVRRGAWVHATTEWGAGEVRDVYGAERVVVVPFGVPPVGPAPEEGDGGPPFVLAIGRTEPRKGHDVLVRAMARVPGVELVVAGPDGGATPAPSGGVRVLGAVPDEERRRLLHSAAVVAYPSLEEGFGFPVLEAMAAGTPVVTTTAGALAEVAGEAAVLVPPGDADALADAIQRVLGDDALRARLVAAGRARAASFSWERHAAGMVDLWRRAAS